MEHYQEVMLALSDSVMKSHGGKIAMKNALKVFLNPTEF